MVMYLAGKLAKIGGNTRRQDPVYRSGEKCKIEEEKESGWGPLLVMVIYYEIETGNRNGKYRELPKLICTLACVVIRSTSCHSMSTQNGSRVPTIPNTFAVVGPKLKFSMDRESGVVYQQQPPR